VQADVSFYISVLQTLTNASGVIARWSTTTTLIAGAPVNSVVPTISGDSMADEVLTADVGTWRATPNPDFTYAWYSCTDYLANGHADTVYVNCTAIPGATSSTYTVSRIYYGKSLSVRITATNTSGSASYMSVSSNVVSSLPFPLTGAGLISAGLQGIKVGSTLTAGAGTWVGHNRPSTTHRWYRCTSAVSEESNTVPSGCTAIGIRDNQTYVLNSIDIGKYISAEIIGTNNKGSVSWWTRSTVDVAQAPEMDTEHVLSGTATSGQTLTVTAGTWSATPTATLSYKWMRCTQQIGSLTTSKPAYCTEISGQESQTYTLTASDVGKYISVQETATNSAGTAIRLTPTTSIVN
jgi:hypothetical protein